MQTTAKPRPKFNWYEARERAYGFATLSGKIASASTEMDLAFIAEQAKTAKEVDKEKLRELWIAKREELKAKCSS